MRLKLLRIPLLVPLMTLISAISLIIVLLRGHLRVPPEVEIPTPLVVVIRAAGVTIAHPFQHLKVTNTSFSVCHTPLCVALYESAASRRSVDRIPRMRHILWKSESVPEYLAKQLKTWGAIHPNWKYVLWRDSDLDKFVAKHFTGALAKFRSLKLNIMRIDMVRFLILYHFGGVYADLDYVLVRSLDRFLKFPAVVTRETEAHAFYHFGMSTFPPPIVGNTAFMMSEPGHPFFHFSVLQLTCKSDDAFFTFAGPLGLSGLLAAYQRSFPLSQNPDGAVIVPASRTFYGYDDNSLHSSTSMYKHDIIHRIMEQCRDLRKQPSMPKALSTYCTDVYNLDPITDRSELVYAIHDFNKTKSSYDPSGSSIFVDNPVDIRAILPDVVMSSTLY